MWNARVKQLQVYKEVKERISYVASFVRTEGFMAFAEAEWLRLNIPLIFRSFWLMRFGIYVYIYLASSEPGTWADTDSLKTLFKIVLIRGCETLPAILAMASIFSWIAGKVNLLLIQFRHFLIPNRFIVLRHVSALSADSSRRGFPRRTRLGRIVHHFGFSKWIEHFTTSCTYRPLRTQHYSTSGMLSAFRSQCSRSCVDVSCS